MSINYAVVNDGHIVVEKFVGMISHAELMDHERRQLHDVTIARTANALIDFRQAKHEETGENIRELVALHGNPDNVVAFVKGAIVVSGTDFGDEKADQIEYSFATRLVTLIVVDNFAVACRWVGIDDKRAQEILDSIVVS